jgi:hypothetical protein
MADNVLFTTSNGSVGVRVVIIATLHSVGIGSSGFGFFILRRKKKKYNGIIEVQERTNVFSVKRTGFEICDG